MTSHLSLEQAWDAAQPRILSISESLKKSAASSSRIFRVGQLDSEALDQELVHLLREPLNKALSLVNASLSTRFEPEITLLIKLTLYKLSVWSIGASYGAQLQDLQYTIPQVNRTGSLAPSGLPRRILFVHGTLSAFVPYLHTRLRTHALSSAWPDAPTSDRRRKAWELLVTLESSYTFLSLANFIAFLWNGRFRSIVDRALRMRLSPSRRSVRRDVSYEFMNRQMVWHAFTEFLIFLLPLLRTRGIRRRINHIANAMSPSSLLPTIGGSSRGNITESKINKGKYWSLPQDQCAICAERASFSLNSEPSNAFPSISLVAAQSASGDTEPPAFPIYNPYITNCGDIYCYHCVAEQMMQAADSPEDQTGWKCLRCQNRVVSAERYTVEVGSDVSSSDYDFSSDISVSMESYGDSGWSDSSSMDV